MKLELDNVDVDAILALLQDAVVRGRNRGEYTAHFTQLQGRITGQQAKFYAGIVDELVARLKNGNTPQWKGVCRTYNITADIAQNLIQIAKEKSCQA